MSQVILHVEMIHSSRDVSLLIFIERNFSMLKRKKKNIKIAEKSV